MPAKTAVPRETVNHKEICQESVGTRREMQIELKTRVGFSGVQEVQYQGSLGCRLIFVESGAPLTSVPCGTAVPDSLFGDLGSRFSGDRRCGRLLHEILENYSQSEYRVS